MDKYYNQILQKMEASINELMLLHSEDTLQHIEKIIELLLEILLDVKKNVLSKSFRTKENEIYFFKYQKPVIVSKLIYYNAIYKIQIKKPNGQKSIKKYLNNEIKKIKRYFDYNLDFYRYYRTNSTYLDEKYFIRGKYDIKLSLDTYYFETDHNFSTSHDYKVAKIMAYDLIQVYLEDQLSNNLSKEGLVLSSLNWTGCKAALIELIYAIQEQSILNNGNTNIKQITKAFEKTFNIDLGDVYHSYLELRSRKMNRTKFIDALRDGLIKKMDEQDEK